MRKMCDDGDRNMNIKVKPMEQRYVLQALDLVEKVFTEWDSPREGRTVRCLTEEIRSKKYYIPELELIAVNEDNDVLGYVMFSRFHIEGKYENELLILTPAAVKTEYQRQHISKQLIEYGFEKAAEMGFKAVLVEGDPKNYISRGFMPSYKYGITAAESVHLPSPDCLMIKELEKGALDKICGTVDYSFYDTFNS